MALRLSLIFIFFSSKLFSHAQDISGVWVGNYKGSGFAANPDKLVVEIIVYNDSLITGLSHLYYKHNEYEHYKIYGVIQKDGTIYFSEDSTIAVKLGPMDENCMGNYTMKLSSTDTSLFLDGRWRDNSTALFHCASTDVWLEKKKDNPKKNITSSKIDNKLERTSDLQSLIELTADEKESITIELYDNGIVDHDSVSLYLDDSMILFKQLVTAKPIILNISPGKKTSLNKLKLVAESLGSIPPCTVFMIIKTKKKRYEVNLSSNFNSNAVVEFFLKE
jgi:hypothetical protein